MKFSVEQSKPNVVSEVAMLLLNGVTAAHIHHWNTIGVGSYAEHQAIGDFYERLEDLADSLIEGCLVKSKIIPGKEALFLGENSLELVQHIYENMAVFREDVSFPQASEVQNVVDEIQMLCRHTLFKLYRLK